MLVRQSKKARKSITTLGGDMNYDTQMIHPDTADQEKWKNRDFDVDMIKDLWDNYSMIKNNIDQFVEDVDSKVMMRLGISVHDLADFPFFDYFNESDDIDGVAYENAVETCAEDFLEQVEAEYGVGLCSELGII